MKSALAMGCLRRIEIREVPELTAPATAGWWHPVILLPDDWRSWNDTDRRAVLAHELAHIHRRDYAAGLVARLALALEFYHPLVHWMARRLQLQQELAADAIAARFAGGTDSYLLSLSRLALKQEGRSPSWPARAFLPARHPDQEDRYVAGISNACGSAVVEVTSAHRRCLPVRHRHRRDDAARAGAS